MQPSHNGRQKAIGCLDRLLSEADEIEYVYDQLKLWLHEDFRQFYRLIIMPLHREPEILPAEATFAQLPIQEQVNELYRLTRGGGTHVPRGRDVDPMEARGIENVQEEPEQSTPEH